MRALLQGLYDQLDAGEPADLDSLRGRLDNPRLTEHALKLQATGLNMTDRAAALRDLLRTFEERRDRPAKQELQNRLQAPGDHAEALELLRQLTNRSNGVGDGPLPVTHLTPGASTAARGGLRGEEGLMEKIDDGLKTLLESGKEKGYLTYDQVNDHLPDDDANPEKIDQILILLEEQGIELIEESEAEEREGGAPPSSTTKPAPNSTSASWTRTTAGASTTRCACT